MNTWENNKCSTERLTDKKMLVTNDGQNTAISAKMVLNAVSRRTFVRLLYIRGAHPFWVQWSL